MLVKILLLLMIPGIGVATWCLIMCDIRDHNEVMEEYYSMCPKKKWNRLERHIYSEEFRDKHTVKGE